MPARPFSPGNSRGMRIVPGFGRVVPMQSTLEMTATETNIAEAERQRRLLRRAVWAGVALVAVVILFVLSQPLYVRWQLRQHGWELETMSRRGLPDWAPQWAVPWFGRFECAHLKRSPLRPGDLELLQRLPEFGSVHLESTEVSELALEKISKLPNLWVVEFDTVKLESAGLRHLATAPKLEALNFFDTVLDETALDGIANCRYLTGLSLTGISDDNLRHLSRLHGLKGLQIKNCRLTDEGARQLVDRFPGLTTLVISDASFSDVAVAEFARLPKLEYLVLSDLPITDAGLSELKTCASLKGVSVKNSKATTASITELRKSLTALEVSIE